jgi:galactose mutarotase-like enzyme
VAAVSGRTIRLTQGSAEAEIAFRGAEPVCWRVGGRDLLWSGDPAHWSYSAPILFPVVGASRDGRISVGERAYPMPQHGFARVSDFAIVERSEASVRLRLVDTDETRASFPFAFRLDIVATLAADTLSLEFEVENTGADAMPYALGFHPAFPWPLAGHGKDGHRVSFEAEERNSVPEVAPGGLLARRTRDVPLDGRFLPLHPELFTEALVFLDARSQSFAFEDPEGAATIELRAEGFPHLAIWSRPDAPFLSLETWTGHADWEDADGDLAGRASMIRLSAGESRRHQVVMAAHGPAGV